LKALLEEKAECKRTELEDGHEMVEFMAWADGDRWKVTTSSNGTVTKVDLITD
jgi:hypothetical protein